MNIKIIKPEDRDAIATVMARAQGDVRKARDYVESIIDDVRKRGDAALVEYTKRFDDESFEAENLIVSEAEIDAAYDRVSAENIAHIRDQISLAQKFHQAQREQMNDWETETESGILVGERWTPIDAAGLYVPGGKNPFPTVQQILAVPAKIANCPRIVSVVSPKGAIDEVLVAAREVGVDEIYRVSGPHAIAALAYGTETISPVQIIAGPGNPYVTAAKILCQEQVAIDMPAGPSEAIILADDSLSDGLDLKGKAAYCAADVLARAEHGPDSAGVLVTDSLELAELTAEAISSQAMELSRRDYVREALSRYSAIVVTTTMDEALDFTNEYAPEHLEVLTLDPRETLKKIRNAGSVFLGLYNPVATGDYASGVNHILPTGTWAKKSSAVGVWTFMKRVQYSEVSRAGLLRLQPIVDSIADVEGLDAHRRSVDIRLE
jgi:histidinol dehydrogenase